jgi:hypothetical protein
VDWHTGRQEVEGDNVKYMVLLYDAPNIRENLSPELIAEMGALMSQLTESGELVGGEALADPSVTKTVRSVGGIPAATDGPYAEAKEHMGGYLLLDVEDEKRAVEIACRWPTSVVSAVEVRALMNQEISPQ